MSVAAERHLFIVEIKAMELDFALDVKLVYSQSEYQFIKNTLILPNK